MNHRKTKIRKLNYCPVKSRTEWSTPKVSSFIDESERGEWKSWLKAQHSENSDHGIWSHHFMENR